MRVFEQKQKATQQIRSMISAWPPSRQSHGADSNLHLQHATGMQRPFHENQREIVAKEGSTGTGTAHIGHDFSRIPVFSDKHVVSISKPSHPAPAWSHSTLGGSTISGRAPGENDNNPGLIGGVISTTAGNIMSGVTAQLTGIGISTADTHAAAWNPHGAFNWRITWNMTGKNVGATTNGWLVQNVNNTYTGVDSAGAAITTARVGATPSYYEAWPVVAGAVQQPWGGVSDDTWGRPDLSVWPTVADAGTKGRWSMTSKVYFTTTDPTAHGLARRNVADAGDLPSSVSAPPDLGVIRLQRYANGNWDSTGSVPIHSGANG